MQVCGSLIQNYYGHNDTSVNLLPWANRVVVLDNTGSIIEQGSFAELNSREGSYVQSFALRITPRSSGKDKAEHVGAFKLGDGPSNALNDSVEDKARQIGDFSVYKYYFSAAGRRVMIIFWTLEVTWACLETFPSIWLKWWSSAITNNEHPPDAMYLGVYAALQIGNLVALFGCAM